MLKITEAQVEAFRARAIAEFEARALHHLRREHPDAAGSLSDKELLGRIRACRARAIAYGLPTQRQLMCFVYTTFRLGEHFDREPAHEWVLALLRGSGAEAVDRAVRLLTNATYLKAQRTGGG